MFRLPGDISLLLLLPLIGALVLLLVPRQQRQTLLTLALLSSIAAFIWSLRLFQAFDPAAGEMQFVQRIPWMPAFGIGYFSPLAQLNSTTWSVRLTRPSLRLCL